MSNQPQDDSTDSLLKNLQERSASQNAPVEEDNSPAEDIDAFLADLEGGSHDAPASSPPAPAAAPDPFADAFAELEDVHGDDVEQELAAKYAAQDTTRAPRTATPEPELPEARQPAQPSEQERAEVEEESMDSRKSASKKERKKKKKKKQDKPLVHVVETQRSRGFLLAMALVKWSLILTPVITAVWLAGALLGSFLSTGWMILLATLLPAILLPLGLKLLLKRGRWWYFAVPLSLLFVAALLFLAPLASGKAAAYYGHWPSSAVSQLADAQPDNAIVRSHAFVTESIGEQLFRLDPAANTVQTASDKQAPILARALGTETELVTWAESQRAAAQKAPAPQEKDAAEVQQKEDAEKGVEPAADEPPQGEEVKEAE